MTKVAIVDPNKYAQLGILKLLQARIDIQVLSVTSNFIGLRSTAKEANLDVIIFDINPAMVMKDITQIVALRMKFPFIKIFAYLHTKTAREVNKIYGTYVDEVIFKHEGTEKLIALITNCKNKKMESNMTKIKKTNNSLTKMENKVLNALANGITNVELSKLLSVSQKTISVHKCNAMKKLGISDVFGLVSYFNNLQQQSKDEYF